MAYLNQKLWKSAYLIEFEKGSILQEAFTFSVPPQSEDFSFPQRVNETKTFGGSVFEDYGNDTVKISLSGTTVNQELKIIYRSSKGKKYLSGQDEIFELRDILREYGDFKNLENKYVYLYALDSGKKNKGGKNQKAWRIWVNDFQIKRNKDMPFTYYYTLNATGVPLDLQYDDKSLLGKFKEKFKDAIDGYNTFLEKLDEGSDWLSEKLGYIDEFTDVLSYLNTQVEALSNALNNYTSLLDGVVDSIDNLKTQTVTLEGTVYNTFKQIRPTNLASELWNCCKNVADSFSDMKEWWIGYSESDSWNKALSNYPEEENTLTDDVNKLISSWETFLFPFIDSAKLNTGTNAVQPIVVPGSNGTDDEIILSNSYKEYSFKEGDTWYTISNDFYGTADYAELLQLYNEEIQLSDLKAGDTVYIPSLNSDNAENLGNKVYCGVGEKDIYGKDIAINNDGDFEIKNNDFVLVKGNENLNQAIQNRLSTSINRRVRNVVYGIRNETGNPGVDASAIASYITSSIERTILADPRIENIESLEWESSDGSTINVNIVYKTITGNVNSYSVNI